MYYLKIGKKYKELNGLSFCRNTAFHAKKDVHSVFVTMYSENGRFQHAVYFYHVYKTAR
jgi:hypothetical protein